MRQAGVLAAAGILSLTEQVQHLQKDHENAQKLASSLADLDGLEIELNDVQTNMILARVTKGSRQGLMDKMKAADVLVSGRRDTLRLVTHYDFKQEQIERVTDVFTRSLANS